MKKTIEPESIVILTYKAPMRLPLIGRTARGWKSMRCSKMVIKSNSISHCDQQ
jgi:hypothetical protein